MIEHAGIGPEERLDHRLVANVALGEMKIGVLPRFAQIVRLVERHHVEGVHLDPLAEQPIDQMAADHAGGAGHHYAIAVRHRPTPL